MLTNQEREFIRQAQVIQYHTDYTTFEEYQNRIKDNKSLTEGEMEDLEYLSDKYGWEIV